MDEFWFQSAEWLVDFSIIASLSIPKHATRDTFESPHQDFPINVMQSHSSRGRYSRMNIYNRSIHSLLSKKLFIPFDNSIIHNWHDNKPQCLLQYIQYIQVVKNEMLIKESHFNSIH